MQYCNIHVWKQIQTCFMWILSARSGNSLRTISKNMEKEIWQFTTMFFPAHCSVYNKLFTLHFTFFVRILFCSVVQSHVHLI